MNDCTNTMPSKLRILLALPWLVLAPLNFVKVFINKPSPLAHNFVPKKTELCQMECDIARMWAMMFWSLQFCLAFALASSKGPNWLFVATKACVGAMLIRSYLAGVVLLPIGCAGGFELLSMLVLLATGSSGSKDKKE